MDITPITPKDMLVLSRYGNGGFVINDVSHQGNILILPGEVRPWEGGGEAMGEASFVPLWTLDPLPEIVIIGTGAAFSGPSLQLRALFRARHIPMDMMDTGAACRTYNVLLGEGRRVAAALLAV